MKRIQPEELKKILKEKEDDMNQVLIQFNQRLGYIQGEVNMINQMIEMLEGKPPKGDSKEEALPSEK